MDDYLQFCLEHELLAHDLHDNADASNPLWFIFHKDRLAVKVTESGTFEVVRVSPEQLGIQPAKALYLGRHLNSDCFLAEIKKETITKNDIRMVPLRVLLGKINQDHFTIAGRGLQILSFHVEHKYCGKCGALTKVHTTELARTCPECQHTSFPRVSPAVIMSVVHKNTILLGRARHFPENMYSTLAGFVEPGETLEEAVKREVLEEVGVKVDTIQYVGSQPWPFPHSMMIGFTARYSSGEIIIDNDELEDAGWFTSENLPVLPRKGTIARHLIDKFINKTSPQI